MKDKRKFLVLGTVLIDTVALIMMLLWKHGFNFIGFILIFVVCILGAILIYKPYEVSKFIIEYKVKFYRRRVMRNFYEAEKHENYPPTKLYVTSERVFGWLLCSIPLILILL